MITFLFEAVLISLSGVMAPGPMTATVIGKGSESPHAGALVSIGHGIIEFPLMVAIYFGFGILLKLPYVEAIIAIVGGLFLLFLALGMFRSLRRTEINPKRGIHSPIIAGILLSLGNPYFLIWWATVGAALIIRSVGYGFAGFMAFAFIHWSCDFVWCYFLSALSFKGGKFFGQKFTKVVFAISGIVLLFFSVKFVISGVKGLL
ncbi:LysE family transporter [bacterium]|nr:LysE family transporter [bacterium]